MISGTVQEGTFSYLGIPYARDALAARRWLRQRHFGLGSRPAVGQEGRGGGGCKPSFEHPWFP